MSTDAKHYPHYIKNNPTIDDDMSDGQAKVDPPTHQDVTAESGTFYFKSCAIAHPLHETTKLNEAHGTTNHPSKLPRNNWLSLSGTTYILASLPESEVIQNRGPKRLFFVNGS